MESPSHPIRAGSESGPASGFIAGFHSMQALETDRSRQSKKPRKSRTVRSYRCPDTIDWLEQMQQAQTRTRAG